MSFVRAARNRISRWRAAPPAGGAGREPRRGLPPAAWAYLGLLVTAAAGVTGLALWVALRATATRAPGGWPGDTSGLMGGPALLAGLVGAAFVAQQVPLTVGPQQKYTLAIAVAFASVLLLAPAPAVLVVALGQVLGQGALALRRDPATGRRQRGVPGVAFNTAQTVLAAGLGGLVYDALRPSASAVVVPADAGGLLAAAAAATAMLVVNTGAVAVMVALQQGGGPRSVWAVWAAARRGDLPEAAGDYLLGFLVAWALPREPWLLVPLAAGAAVVYRAFARRAALLQREAAVAQQAGEAAALRELHRLKDEFLGTVSHELRTPLTVVCGFTELLQAQGESLPPPARDMVGHLAAGTDRLVRLLDDLLEFTRLQQGALGVRPVAVDLVPVLHEVLSGFRPQPGGDRLVAALPVTLPGIADPARVAQAVSNLIANALKYAPQGPVTLRAGAVEGPPASVRIAVEDHGPGVPASEQARVWEQFYRGTAAAGVAPGMGVGLAVVKALTEAQGGRVGLSSAAGRGSCFWLELPTAGPRPDSGETEDRAA